jgi:hypothetical protein
MSSTAADALSDARPRDQDGLPTRSRTRRRLGFALIALFAVITGAIVTSVVFAAMWPVTFDSRGELFEIPKGTWARRMAGEKREILPSTIHLVVGMRDTLVLKNSDDVPQMFGPTLLMPGQTFSLPFTTPSENYFACTAHASGQLLIAVEAAPTGPWSRLSWRVRRMLRRLSEP